MPGNKALKRNEVFMKRGCGSDFRTGLFALSAILVATLLSSETGAAKSTVSSIPALQSAANSAHSGDTILLADGVYTNASLVLSTNGISIMAATPGGSYLKGTQAIKITGDSITFGGFQFTSGSIPGFVIEVQGSHNLLTLLNFSGYSAQKYIVLQSGSRYNEIRYCNFENKPASAPIGNLIHVAADATIVGYHKIRYCSFQNMQGNGGDNGNECIRLSNGAQSTYVARTVVEYCYFNNTGRGDSECISVKCRENTIRYCTFDNNPEAMLVFRNGSRNVAYGNFFINGSGGIRVKEADDIYCYNNYFESSGISGIMNAITLIYVSPFQNNINFNHNTFVNCGLIDLGGIGPKQVTFTNNIFHKSAGTIFINPNGQTTWVGNLYQGTLGIDIASGMTNADALLIANSEGYVGLSARSPAIDAASSSYTAILNIDQVDDDPLLNFDISKQPRPAAATLKDVGCDEYGAGSTYNRPLKLSDTGPSYLQSPVARVREANGSSDQARSRSSLSGSFGGNEKYTLSGRLIKAVQPGAGKGGNTQGIAVSRHTGQMQISESLIQRK